MEAVLSIGRLPEHTFDLIKTYLDGGVNTYMYFNMVLQDEGASSWGWKQNALVRVLSSTKEAVYTPEFYLLKHLSHFLKPGAHKLKVEKGNDVLAFRNRMGNRCILHEQGSCRAWRTVGLRR